MPITDEQFKALEDKVKDLSANAESVTEAVGKAVKPLEDKITALEANQQAADEAKRKEYSEQVVNAGLLDEEEVKELSVNALQKLAAKSKPGTAAPIMPHFAGNKGSGSITDAYQLPEGE